MPVCARQCVCVGVGVLLKVHQWTVFNVNRADVRWTLFRIEVLQSQVSFILFCPVFL